MKVITPVTNNIEFIKIQYYSFKKFINVPYDFIVFNDSKKFQDWTNYGDITIHEKIINTCDELGIECINIPNDHHKNETRPGKRHIESIEFITKYMFENPDIYFQIDSDMFLVDFLDFNKFNKYDCAVVKQNHTGFDYVWPNLFYFNIHNLKYKELINWDGMHGADTGGRMNKWLEMYTENNNNLIYFIKHLPSLTWKEEDIPKNITSNNLIIYLKSDPRNTKDGKFWCEIYDNNILHYRAGSNWNGEGKLLHYNLTLKLKDILT